MNKLFDHLKIFDGTSNYEKFILGTSFVDPNFSTYSNNSNDVDYNPYLYIIFENANTATSNIQILKNTDYLDNIEYIKIDNNEIIASPNIATSYLMSPGKHEVIYKFTNNLLGTLRHLSTGELKPLSRKNLSEIINSSVSNNIININVPKTMIGISLEAYKNIKHLNIQKHIKIILTGADEMKNLETINIEHGNNTYLENNYNILVNNNNINTVIKGCKNSILPDYINIIGSYAFYKCKDLKNINLDNINTINHYAFNECKKLEFVNLDNVSTINQYAFSGCENLKNINLHNVTSIGENAFEGCKSIENIDLYNIETINLSVFSKCSSLTNIYNTENIKYIGISAFFECKNLKDINFQNATIIDDSTFRNCNSLEIINIPNCTKLGGETFENCYNLSEIDLPCVTTIGGRTFENCTNLGTVNMPNVQRIGGNAFTNTNIKILNIPSCCTYLNHNRRELYNDIIPAFYTLEKTLEEIHIDQNNPIYTDGPDMNYIAIKNNDNTQTLILGCKNSGTTIGTTIHCLPASVTEILDKSFENCPIAEINFPNSLATIGAQAFQNCTNLKKLYIPENISSIGINAFRNCYGLESIIVNSNNTTYSSIGEDNTNINAILINNKILLKGCKNTNWNNIPSTITTISNDAFYNINLCTSNNSTVIIGENITNINSPELRYCKFNAIEVNNNNQNYYSSGNCLIRKSDNKILRGCRNSVIPTNTEIKILGDYVFMNNDDLLSIHIPNNIEEIGNYTFNGCSSLEFLEIPEKVNKIGNNTFKNCKNLNFITFLSETPPTIGNNNPFDTTNDNLIIYVPSSDIYKNTWSNLGTSILEKINDYIEQS